MISEKTASEAITTRKAVRRRDYIPAPNTQRAHEQRRVHHAVQHDHQGGKRRVASERRVFSPCSMIEASSATSMMITESVSMRTVRLAKPFGDSLGVAHHAEGASHHRAEQP